MFRRTQQNKTCVQCKIEVAIEYQTHSGVQNYVVKFTKNNFTREKRIYNVAQKWEGGRKEKGGGWAELFMTTELP